MSRRRCSRRSPLIGTTVLSFGKCAGHASAITSAKFACSVAQAASEPVRYGRYT
jgi:hypothetical protein